MRRERVGLRIPYDLNTWLIRRARTLGFSKNALVVQILWDWVGREDSRKTKDAKEG